MVTALMVYIKRNLLSLLTPSVSSYQQMPFENHIVKTSGKRNRKKLNYFGSIVNFHITLSQFS
jgi:hypothetical protein